jgi:hypothetical protein
MIDGTQYALMVLKSRGYEIISARNIESNRIISTSTDNFFLKNDSRPWFAPIDVKFKGPGMAVNAGQFEKYIRPLGLAWLYHYGEFKQLYHVSSKNFLNAEQTFQNNGERVYVYPLNKSERWDVLKEQAGFLDR